MSPTRFLAFFAACIVFPGILVAQVSQEITADELHAHVSYLASDALKGRHPSDPGALKAAEYIRSQFRDAGVRLLADDGFQHFPIIIDISAGTQSSLQIGETKAVLQKDFIPLSFSAEKSLRAGVVCVGYGFDYELDSSAWHDYHGREVDGHWVLILRGSPDEDSGDFDPFSSLRKKALVAMDHGAAGVLFASGPAFQKEDALVELNYQKQEASMDIPVLSISRALADQLLSGMSVAELEAKLNTERAPVSCETTGMVAGNAQLKRHSVDGVNVVGVIDGSDAELAGEYVIVGAHYDHLGMGGPGSGSRAPDTVAVHNGADDNASGTAAVIEISERIAAHPLPRPVLVVCFTAEEMGLLGSKYFVANPPVDLGKTVLMCNLDMVGHMKEGEKTLSIGGTGTATGLEDMVKSVVEKDGFTATMSPEGYGPSDHASFYTENIPVLFFFTGIHEDYHLPSDDTELCNFPGEKLVADLVTDIITAVATRSDALVYAEAGPKSRPPASKRFKVTLGIMPDVSGSGTEGLRADAVIDGRPASRAGMKKGDVIVAMEGKPVKDIYQYMDRLSEFKSGQRISVDVMRDGKKVVLIVEL